MLNVYSTKSAMSASGSNVHNFFRVANFSNESSKLSRYFVPLFFKELIQIVHLEQTEDYQFLFASQYRVVEGVDRKN